MALRCYWRSAIASLWIHILRLDSTGDESNVVVCTPWLRELALYFYPKSGGRMFPPFVPSDPCRRRCFDGLRHHSRPIQHSDSPCTCSRVGRNLDHSTKSSKLGEAVASMVRYMLKFWHFSFAIDHRTWCRVCDNKTEDNYSAEEQLRKEAG